MDEIMQTDGQMGLDGHNAETRNIACAPALPGGGFAFTVAIARELDQYFNPNRHGWRLSICQQEIRGKIALACDGKGNVAKDGPVMTCQEELERARHQW
jgi:hypothetical protein